MKQKKQKFKSAKRLLRRTGLYPANHAEPRPQKLAATSFPQSRRFSKYCYALAGAQATIVLPAFARSFFADRKKKTTIKICHSERSEESNRVDLYGR
ncbi:MAG: hypothetical protein JKY70_22395 [Mucilaginibacter sp.]|nr:hypothetical protein [Mucilaginibacter sp.]